jgi:hypothetical protein
MAVHTYNSSIWEKEVDLQVFKANLTSYLHNETLPQSKRWGKKQSKRKSQNIKENF